MKKAQVTIFAILGIIMFILIAFVIYASTNTSDPRVENEFFESEVELFVESCLENSLRNSLNDLKSLNSNNPLFERLLMQNNLEARLQSDFQDCNLAIFEDRVGITLKACMMYLETVYLFLKIGRV